MIAIILTMVIFLPSIAFIVMAILMEDVNDD